MTTCTLGRAEHHNMVRQRALKAFLSFWRPNVVFTTRASRIPAGRHRRPFSPPVYMRSHGVHQRSLPSLASSRMAARGDGHAAAVAATRTRPAERRPNDIARIYRAFPARTPTSSRPLLLVFRGRRGGKGARNGPARAGLVRASAACFLRPRHRAQGVRRAIFVAPRKHGPPPP